LLVKSLLCSPLSLYALLPLLLLGRCLLYIIEICIDFEVFHDPGAPVLYDVLARGHFRGLFFSEELERGVPLPLESRIVHEPVQHMVLQDFVVSLVKTGYAFLVVLVIASEIGS